MELFDKILPNIQNTNNAFIKLPIIINDNNNLFKLIYKLDYNIFSISVYSDTKYLGNYNFTNKDNTNKINCILYYTVILSKEKGKSPNKHSQETTHENNN